MLQELQISETVEKKPEFHTFSYVTISGRLYDNYCVVHSTDKRYLRLVSDHFGVISSGKLQPYSFNVNASPTQLFSLMGSEGYNLVTRSSGPNHVFRTWIFIKEGSPCNCSCHICPDPPDEGSSPPKIPRVVNPKETEKEAENDEPIPVDYYNEIMEHFKIPNASNPLTAAELFSLLSTAGFQVPFRS